MFLGNQNGTYTKSLTVWIVCGQGHEQYVKQNNSSYSNSIIYGQPTIPCMLQTMVFNSKRKAHTLIS